MKRPEFIRVNVDLKDFNTWKIGGAADYFCEPKTKEEMILSLRWAKAHQHPITILGSGSNVFIADEGIEGLVLCTKKWVGISEQKDSGFLILDVLSGTPKYEVMRKFLKHKLSPALFLSGLPGDVGGGIVMNAGVAENRQPREFCEIVESVVVMSYSDQTENVHKQNEFKWSYRYCSGWESGLIFSARLKWPMNPVEDIPVLVKEANRLRLAKQPLDMPSCGSTFMNPPGHKAGQLIEAQGLKGFSIGGAQISPKHANFFVNTGQATAKDLHQLILHAKAIVKEKTGIDLHTEVKYLGRWPQDLKLRDIASHKSMRT